MSNALTEEQRLLQEIIFKISDKYDASQTVHLLSDAETIHKIILAANKSETSPQEPFIKNAAIKTANLIVTTYHGFGFILEKEYLLRGKKIARKGWNGKNMYVYYVPAASYPAGRNILATMKGHYKNDMVEYNAYLALKGVDGKISTWVPSITDLLAEDWYIVE